MLLQILLTNKDYQTNNCDTPLPSGQTFQEHLHVVANILSAPNPEVWVGS